MPEVSRPNLKSFFQTGEKPTQAEFETLINETVNVIDDKASDTEAEDDTIDTKFITPKTAKKSVEKFAPVKKVNNINPDSLGNVLVGMSDISGLGDAFDDKQDVLVSGTNIRTVNGQTLLGNSDLIISASGPTILSGFLTSDQTSYSNTFVVLNNHTFTLPAGKKASLVGNLTFSSNDVGSGGGYGIEVTNPSDANGHVIGSFCVDVCVISTPGTSSVKDGDAFDVAPNATVSGSTTAGSSPALSPPNPPPNAAATVTAVFNNLSTNTDATIKLVFRSELATAIITAKKGSGAILTIS